MEEIKEAVSSNAESKSLTPKERFDAEMKDINKTISSKNAPEKEAGWTDEQCKEHDEDVEELDKMIEENDVNASPEEQKEFINKHMGTVKHTVTKEQYMHQKLEEQRKQILGKFTGVGGLRRDKLSSHDEKTMSLILGCVQKGTITDPVVKHLVQKKIDLAAEQVKLNVEIKELQLEIVNRMSMMVEKAQSGQAAVDAYNRDILLYVQKNPNVILDNNNKD